MSGGKKSSGPPPKNGDPVPELRVLLGPAVFIAWPKGTKGTKKKWKHLTLASMTPEYLAGLKTGNIGVALGEVSEGLCAIDLDDARLVKPFLAGNPELRDTLQTHGSRGRVFWVRCDGPYPKRSSKLKSRSGEEVGEFRSNGNQSIVWGTHPDTGEPYQFIVRKPAKLVRFGAIRWPTMIAKPPTLQSDGDTEVINSGCSASPSSLATPSLCLSVNSLPEAVEVSLPTQVHRNNAALFTLARALKAFEARRGESLTRDEKNRAFADWHDRVKAAGLLREGLGRDEYLAEFMHALRKAKIPLGMSPAEQALERAKSEPPPAEAEVFTSAESKLLVAVCHQLHLAAKGEPWFLPTRTAAKLIGKTHTYCAKLLSALVAMGVLEIAESHTTIRATRYRYVAGGHQRREE
jgi:hypothetical protein